MHLDIHNLLHHYGYGGVFTILSIEMLGIPFPAETTLTVAGIAWTKGVFALFPLLLVATSANIFGSTLAYGIGRYFGRTVLLRFGRRLGMTEERLNKAEATMNKYRVLVIFAAKFIVGIRVFLPYLAGINRMPFMKFSILNSMAAFIWVVIFIFMGKYIGMGWRHYHHALQPYTWQIITTLALIIIGFLVIKRARKVKGY
ncbi:MAG: DedA family protein [Bacilli bacterium]|nr:DedA family protein [Bacilli bacterium]